MSEQDDMIQVRLKLLDNYMVELRRLQPTEFEEYVSNYLIHRTVERDLIHRATQAQTQESLKVPRRKQTAPVTKQIPHVDSAGMARFFAQQPEVVVAYLFGSVARGQADAASDVDIAILLDHRIGSRRFGKLQLRYMMQLGDLCQGEPDIVILNHAPPLLQDQVIRYGRAVYERSHRERIAYEVKALSLYFDVKPMLDQQLQMVFDELKEGGLGVRYTRYRRTATVHP